MVGRTKPAEHKKLWAAGNGEWNIHSEPDKNGLNIDHAESYDPGEHIFYTAVRWSSGH